MKKTRGNALLVEDSPAPGDATYAAGTSGIDILHVEYRDIATLIPYARNARIHDEAHVAQLAASIREWGWTMPVLVDEQGGIIAGHGRVMAARKLGIERVPVLVARGWSEAKKRAYILADNKLTLNAKWDRELLAGELAELAPLCELSLTGFSATELGRLLEADGLSGAAQLGDGLVYHVIVDCSGEQQQGELLERLQGEGFQCRALIA
jgi:ParB-like chromosome segregation protein Spo0J